MKKLIAFLFCVGAAAGGYYYYAQRPRQHSLTEKQLTFAVVQQVPMRDIVSATGVVEAREIVLLSSEMPGTLKHLYARVNDLVSDGTVLAELDNRKVELAVEEADNQVRNAQAAVAQAEALKDAADRNFRVQVDLEKSGGFRSERDQAEANAKAAAAGLLSAHAKLRSAQTGHKQARLSLDQLQLRVPSTGTPTKREFLILERKAQEGQFVGPQSPPLFVLAGSLDKVEIHTQVAEGDIAKVRKGLEAIFTVTTYAEEEVEFRGTVREIRPLAANLKGAVYYDTVIDVVNQKDPTSGEWRLRPGMTISVDIIRREHTKAWRVPSAALNLDMDEAFQTDAVKERIAKFKQRPDAKNWSTLWTWDEAAKEVRPQFVRIGGTDAKNEPGLKDGEGNEILEWEAGQAPAAPLRIIIGAPKAKAPGMFDQPANLKMA